MINAVYNICPSVGLKHKDGTQTISYCDSKGANRMVLSTPEKIDTFISEREQISQNAAKMSSRWIYIPLAIGAAVGAIVGCRYDDAETALEGLLCGSTIGLLFGGMGQYSSHNKFVKLYEEAAKKLEIKPKESEPAKDIQA